MSREIIDEFDYFTDDFLQEKIPSTIALVGSSKIDDLLLQIICKYLLPKISKKMIKMNY